MAEKLYESMSGGGERCELVYAPSVDMPATPGPDTCEAAIRNAMEERLGRVIAQGHTVTGPHRDDLLVEDWRHAGWPVRLEGPGPGPLCSR